MNRRDNAATMAADIRGLAAKATGADAWRRVVGFGHVLVAALCMAASARCRADAMPVAVEDLRTPAHAIALVSERQQDAYKQVLSAYAKEETALPGDVSLVLARCRFTEGFALDDDEGPTWGEAAQADLQGCLNDLDTRFHGDAEAGLFTAEHRYGKAALAYARTLLPLSGNWTTQQRSRLHAVFARAYLATKDTRLAGQEALAAVQLDPGSNQLIPALRFLCDDGRRSLAESMLANAPAPSPAWMGGQRLRFAADNLSASAALTELQRVQDSKTPVDPWLSARIYQRAGRYADAAKMLAMIKTQPSFQSVEQYQLRVNISEGQGDPKAASVALRDWFGKTGITGPLLFAYGSVLARAPGELFTPSLAPLALSMLALLATLLCLPGLVAFPAHYRGTVRAREQKPALPLFEPLGLRHMWIGLATFLVISIMVPLLSPAGSVQALVAHRPMTSSEERAVILSQLAMLFMGALCLLPALRHLSWRRWLGERGMDAALITVISWTLFKGFLLMAAAHAPHAAGVFNSTPHDRSVSALASAATHVGGVGLALLIVAVLVPVYEELVFRGFILGGLSRHIAFGWANLWQALLFALLHFDMTHFVFYFALGLMGGWLVKRTGGLAASVALHAANNALACVAILLTT